jgi:SAM-dependent methyltransferase
MQRETSNLIRYVIEEWIPPALRDSAAFRWTMERAWGPHIRELAEFRKRAPFLTPQEYEDLYRVHPRVHQETDNSKACISAITENIVGESVCDVGCGTGYLLSLVKRVWPTLHYTGVDFVFPDGQPTFPGIEFREGMIEDLPFEDGAFDTVICTHVLEHILDFRRALSELRRIAKKRLIIVVPMEREGRYTFNPHFNFFPYPESFLRAMHPIPERHECRAIGRDILYYEDLRAL